MARELESSGCALWLESSGCALWLESSGCALWLESTRFARASFAGLFVCWLVGGHLEAALLKRLISFTLRPCGGPSPRAGTFRYLGMCRPTNEHTIKQRSYLANQPLRQTHSGVGSARFGGGSRRAGGGPGEKRSARIGRGFKKGAGLTLQ